MHDVLWMILAHSKSSVRDAIKKVLIIAIIITITTLYPEESKVGKKGTTLF